MRLSVGLVFALVLALVPSAAASEHGNYDYKWPWLWSSSGFITTYPFSGGHGCQPRGQCVAAYDIVLSDDKVISAREGQVQDTEADILGCGPGLGFGNFAKVNGVTYAHLSQVWVAQGGLVYQGDQIGVQGATGRVEPCPGGIHLHWGRTSQRRPTLTAEAPRPRIQ